jgi:hypothetical protein
MNRQVIVWSAVAILGAAGLGLVAAEQYEPSASGVHERGARVNPLEPRLLGLTATWTVSPTVDDSTPPAATIEPPWTPGGPTVTGQPTYEPPQAHEHDSTPLHPTLALPPIALSATRPWFVGTPTP